MAGFTDAESMNTLVRVVSAAFCTIPLAFVATALSRIFSALMTSIGQNPVVIDKGLVMVLIAAALTEAIGLLILLIACIILFFK